MLNTKVTAVLDAAGHVYDILPHAEPVFTVAAAAAQRGVVLDEMVKSILLREKGGRRRYVMACIPGAARLDARAVRNALPGDWKRLTFASAAEITAVTGYTQGAVAPLALDPGIPIIFDASIAACRRVNISSGDPLAGLELDPRALIELSGAQLASIAA